MWKIYNKLFGWNYINYTDSATSFVAKVYKLKNGQVRMIGGIARGHYNDNLTKNGHFLHRPYSHWDALTWNDTVENDFLTSDSGE